MTRRGAYQAGAQGLVARSLGGRVRAVRMAFGWTQRELAALLHVPQASVSQWESGKAKPSGPVLAHLARVLGLTEEAIVQGTGFTLPSLPVRPEEAMAIWLVVEGASPRRMLLPPAAAGEVWHVPLGDCAAEPLSKSEVTRRIAKALGAGGAAWILVREP